MDRRKHDVHNAPNSTLKFPAHSRTHTAILAYSCTHIAILGHNGQDSKIWCLVQNRAGAKSSSKRSGTR